MDKYLVIYNDFVDISSPYYLNPYQLYLYAVLCSRRNIGWNNLETNIDLLAQMVIFLAGKEKPSRNKNRVKEVLLQLQHKGVIECDMTNLKNDKLLDITFPKMENGFEKIDVDILLKTNSPEELYIYYYVTRFKKGFKQSYEDIGVKIGCKKSYAEKIINNMIEKKLIIKEPGQYKSNGKQEINTYYLYDKIKAKGKKKKVPEDKVADMIRKVKCPIVKTKNSNMIAAKEVKIQDVKSLYYYDEEENIYKCVDIKNPLEYEDLLKNKTHIIWKDIVAVKRASRGLDI